MERLTRWVIYIGMGIGLSLFTLLLFVSIPFLLEHPLEQWQKIGDDKDSSKSELQAKFQGHPAYKLMYERFPDAKEEMSYYGEKSGRMRVGVMNFDTNNYLVLHLNYRSHEDLVEAHVECMNISDVTSETVDSLFAEEFIQNTGCLNAAP